MSGHLSRQFDLELESIRTRILQMGGLVERQVQAGIHAFSSGNIPEMRSVIRADREVDAYEVSIDEDCTLLIARRQPTARDLRLVVAVSRIVTDLERCGDKAAKIAKKSRKLYRSGGHGIPRTDVDHCGRLAVDMLKQALDALARMDAEAARLLIDADGAVDDSFNAIVRQLITDMMEDPRTIGRALDIIWVAKAIERVADHATNIAENVVYVVSGVDIRHSAATRKTDTR